MNGSATLARISSLNSFLGCRSRVFQFLVTLLRSLSLWGQRTMLHCTAPLAPEAREPHSLFISHG